MYMGNGNGCGCNNGLSGMGLLPPSSVEETPWWERVIDVGEDIYQQIRTGSNVPTYTPPIASDYPTYYPTAPAAMQTDFSSIMPWVLGAILLYVVTRK